MTARRRRIIVAVVLAVVVQLLMVASGMGPDLLLVSALIAALTIGALALAAAADAVPNATPTVAAPRSAAPARPDRRVNQVRTGLAYGRNDGLSRERLHTSLVAIVDDQLRSAHQIERTADPATARAVMGTDLAAFVEAATPPDVLSRPRELDRLLTRIEQL